MALITKIKEYREQAGYKQSELAELVGARRETIVHLENGKYNPSLKLAMDIAKVFSVTVEDLFEFINDKTWGMILYEDLPYLLMWAFLRYGYAEVW